MTGTTPSTVQRQRRMKLILLLVGLAFSAATFVTLDGLRTTAARRKHDKVRSGCFFRDQVGQHVLKPNCTCIMNWGRSPYELSTNNLGFRDEKVREVPLADARPRILMLGNSFTQSMTAWRDSYVGRIAAELPQYDFLNGGVMGYSVSHYLNETRSVLAKGVDIDEVIVFAGVTEVHDEAVSQDGASGAVILPEGKPWVPPFAMRLAMRFALTYSMVESVERFLVRHGYYHVSVTHPELSAFDVEATAWTYRKVNEADPFPVGYGPLGVEGGAAKAKAKMTLLWQELQKRNIPISVVVYPYPAQLLHDTPDSKQVRLWRDWCEGKCKRFINVFPVFFAAKEQCPRLQPGCWYPKLFIFGDMHYNAAGNALVADAVLKSLTEEPPAKRSGTNLRAQSGEGLGAH